MLLSFAVRIFLMRTVHCFRYRLRMFLVRSCTPYRLCLDFTIFSIALCISACRYPTLLRLAVTDSKIACSRSGLDITKEGSYINFCSRILVRLIILDCLLQHS